VQTRQGEEPSSSTESKKREKCYCPKHVTYEVTGPLEVMLRFPKRSAPSKEGQQILEGRSQKYHANYRSAGKIQERVSKRHDNKAIRSSTTPWKQSKAFPPMCMNVRVEFL